MPVGAGGAPAGAGQSGYGVPDLGQSPLNAPLPDVTTNLPQTGRYINYVTGDYQFTSDGRPVGFGTVPQLVTLALVTVLGSSAVPDLGQTFTTVQEKQGDYQRQMAARVRDALSNLIKAGQVQLVDVVVQEYPSNPDATAVFVKWRDLTQGPNAKIQTTPVGP